MRDIRLGPAALIAGAAEDFAFCIQEQHRGKATHPVLFGQGPVSFLKRRRDLRAAREVGQKKDKIVLGVGLKFRLGEYLFVQLDAPSAPVRP